MVTQAAMGLPPARCMAIQASLGSIRTDRVQLLRESAQLPFGHELCGGHEPRCPLRGLGSPPAGKGAPGSGGAGPAYAPTSLSSFVSGPGLFR